VATLPLRNQQGSYDEHVMPDLPTSAAVGEYIQNRRAAWRQHVQRRAQRRKKTHRPAEQPGRPPRPATQRAKGRRGRKR
jgi:phospholipase C